MERQWSPRSSSRICHRPPSPESPGRRHRKRNLPEHDQLRSNSHPVFLLAESLHSQRCPKDREKTSDFSPRHPTSTTLQVGRSWHSGMDGTSISALHWLDDKTELVGSLQERLGSLEGLQEESNYLGREAYLQPCPAGRPCTTQRCWLVCEIWRWGGGEWRPLMCPQRFLQRHGLNVVVVVGAEGENRRDITMQEGWKTVRSSCWV